MSFLLDGGLLFQYVDQYIVCRHLDICCAVQQISGDRQFTAIIICTTVSGALYYESYNTFNTYILASRNTISDEVLSFFFGFRVMVWFIIAVCT